MSTISTVAPSSFLGPILGFEKEDQQLKMCYYKILTATQNGQTPLTFSVSDEQPFERTELHRTTQFVFERFRFAIPMQDTRSSFSYMLDNHTFNVQVPGLNQDRVFDIFSCNDYQSSEEKANAKNPEHLWETYENLLNSQPEFAPDVLYGIGDQGYFDEVFETPLLSNWVKLLKADPETALQQPCPADMQQEIETYYLDANIKRFFSDSAFQRILSHVPFAATQDDHDTFDGVGSYPAVIENCPVIQAIKKAARDMYYLFQLQTFPNASEFIGTASTRVGIVGRTAVLLPDTRAHRTLNQIMDPQDWKTSVEFLENNQTNYDHINIVFPVPFIYADFSAIESILQNINDHLFGVIKQKTSINYNQLGLLKETINYTNERLKNALNKDLINTSQFDETRALTEAIDSHLTDNHLVKSQNDELKFNLLFLADLVDKLKSNLGQLEPIDDLADRWEATAHQEEFKKVLADVLRFRSWGKSVLITSGDVHHGCETQLRSKDVIDDAYDANLIDVAITSSSVNKIATTMAYFLPLIFEVQNKEVTANIVKHLKNLQHITNGETIKTIAKQNFLRITEVANQGLNKTWYSSNGTTFDQYQGVITPIYKIQPQNLIKRKKVPSSLKKSSSISDPSQSQSRRSRLRKPSHCEIL